MINNNNLHKIEKSLLEELEQKRVKAEKKSSLFSYAVVYISMALFLYFLYGAKDSGVIVPLSFVVIIGTLIYAGGNAVILGEYESRFKLDIIKPLLEGINETFHYNPTRNMPRYIFRKSKLFGHFNKYYGDDFISGEVDGVKFSLSELSVHDERNSGKNKVIVKIFQGIFCEFDFNKHFSSTLLIYPDKAEKYFGNFGKWLQSINFTKDQLIYLDNPEFEKHFVVYGSDQIEARYLLTYSMMEYILELKERLNAPIYISFNESKLYVGVDYDGAEQFEPDITASLLDSTYIQSHIEKINYHIEIIENFKLNEYLWSKQPKRDSKAELKQEIQTKIISNIVSKENLSDNDDESKEIVENQESNAEIENKKATYVRDVYNRFNTQATDLMKSLEKQRQGVTFYKIVFTILMIVGSIALSFLISKTMYKAMEAIGVLWLFVYIAIMFGNGFIGGTFSRNYKEKLITKLFKHIDPALIYKPYNAITQDEIYESSFFKDWSSAYRGDLIEGKISDFNVKGSRLEIELESSAVFKGYLFIVDLEKYSDLNLLIYPLRSNHDAGRTAKVTIFDEDSTEDIEYLKRKTYIYGDNEDAAQILTKEFISKYLYFYRVLEVKKVYTSFKDSKMYIGFDFDKDFFQAPTSNKVDDEDKFMFYINFFNAVEELMDSI